MTEYVPDDHTTERTSKEYLSVNSCGVQLISLCDRGSKRLNGRKDYHILYVQRGVCHVEMEGKEHQVGEGGVIFFPPQAPQIYHYKKEDRSISHYIHFTGEGCQELLEQLGLHRMRIFRMGRSHSYEEISEKMAREYAMSNRFWEQRCAGLLQELLSIVARKYALRETGVSSSGESRINGVCQVLYEHSQDPPSAGDLAALCCLSESRFTHLFREVTGKSLQDFIAALRMEKARELLSATDMPVREIGEAVGYGDQNYFSRRFKSIVGCSPREYRRRETE